MFTLLQFKFLPKFLQNFLKPVTDDSRDSLGSCFVAVSQEKITLHENYLHTFRSSYYFLIKCFSRKFLWFRKFIISCTKWYEARDTRNLSREAVLPDVLIYQDMYGFLESVQIFTKIQILEKKYRLSYSLKKFKRPCGHAKSRKQNCKGEEIQIRESSIDSVNTVLFSVIHLRFLFNFDILICLDLRPWSSWTANSDKKLNVNKPCVTSRITALRKFCKIFCPFSRCHKFW